MRLLDTLLLVHPTARSSVQFSTISHLDRISRLTEIDSDQMYLSARIVQWSIRLHMVEGSVCRRVEVVDL